MGVLQTSNMLIWKNFVHAYDILGNKIHTVPAQPARHPKISFSLAFKYAQKMKNKNDYLRKYQCFQIQVQNATKVRTPLTEPGFTFPTLVYSLITDICETHTTHRTWIYMPHTSLLSNHWHFWDSHHSQNLDFTCPTLVYSLTFVRLTTLTG